MIGNARWLWMIQPPSLRLDAAGLVRRQHRAVERRYCRPRDVGQGQPVSLRTKRLALS
jgi:hypothetical protein